MRNFRIIFVGLITLSIISATSFLVYEYIKPKPGGVRVISNVKTRVYVDDKFLGSTPFRGNMEAGQISLKLVPDIPGSNLSPYETKLNLVSGIQTVVVREFSPSEETTATDIITFDKTGGKLAGLVVISSPDNAQVWIDGIAQGQSPYNFNSITTGPHTVTVKSEGFKDRNMNIKTIAGLRLNIYTKLSKDNGEEEQPSPTPTPYNGPKRTVIIGSTDTGFLRMRTAPDTKGEEIAELKTGDKYPWLEMDSETGWHKIRYKDPAPGLPNGITGWVSGRYVKVVDDNGKPANLKDSPEPSPSATP